jgi:hypothetical protein
MSSPPTAPASSRAHPRRPLLSLLGLAILVAGYAVGTAAGAVVSLGVAAASRDPWAAAGSPAGLAAGTTAVFLLYWAAATGPPRVVRASTLARLEAADAAVRAAPSVEHLQELVRWLDLLDRFAAMADPGYQLPRDEMQRELSAFADALAAYQPSKTTEPLL